MNLKHRIKMILEEQGLKRKEFADSIKVTESYITNLLNGKRATISETLAALIERQYNYSAHWILTGEGDKMVSDIAITQLSPVKRRLLSDIKLLSEDDLKSTLAFIETLKKIKSEYSQN